MMRMRPFVLAALALFCSSVFADCRQASGGRLQGLKSAVIWHARTACGGILPALCALSKRCATGLPATRPAWCAT